MGELWLDSIVAVDGITVEDIPLGQQQAGGKTTEEAITCAFGGVTRALWGPQKMESPPVTSTMLWSLDQNASIHRLPICLVAM